MRVHEFTERLTVQQACRRIERGSCLDAAHLFAVRTIEEHEADREERERQQLEERGCLCLPRALGAEGAVHDKGDRRESEEDPRAIAARSSSTSQCRHTERGDRNRDRKIGACNESLQRHVREHARENETRDVPIVCMRGFSTRLNY